MNITDNYCAKTGKKLNRAWREGDRIILDDLNGLVSYNIEYKPYICQSLTRCDIDGYASYVPMDYQEAVKEIEAWSKPKLPLMIALGLNGLYVCFLEGETEGNWYNDKGFFVDPTCYSREHFSDREQLSNEEALVFLDKIAEKKLPAVAYRGHSFPCILLFPEGEEQGVWFYKDGKSAPAHTYRRENSDTLKPAEYDEAVKEAIVYLLKSTLAEGRD